jgi:cobalt/nickel transport system ATP-binding protein
VSGEALQHRVGDALERVGMGSAGPRAPHHLSGGERRRVAVATVLAMEPEILVLDEPSSNLDPLGRRRLAEVLNRLDITLILVTHDLPYALQLCRRAVILNEGRVAADGPTPSIMGDPSVMAVNQLELPPGFDPGLVIRRQAVDPD